MLVGGRTLKTDFPGRSGATANVAPYLMSLALLCGLTACGGGDAGGSPAPSLTYTVGGAVSGLQGTGLVLQNNGGDNLAISQSGAFAFANGLTSGAAYSVSVVTQPSSPAQSCEVTNGSGSVSMANVTNVMVSCAPSPFVALANQPPEMGFLTLLLTDGSVMMQSVRDVGVFYNLKPDATGNYFNGTWRKLSSPPTGYAPYASAEAVLADGRVLFVGGEYNQNVFTLPFAPSGLTNMSAVYDPVADSWTMIPPPPGLAYIGEPPATVQPDGSFIFGTKLGREMWRLDPANLTWTSVSAVGKADDFAEEGWVLLPNGNIFTIDVGNSPHAEHYDPASGHWYSDADTPVSLTSPTGSPNGLTFGPAPIQVVGGVTYGPGPTGTYFPPGEVGPALLLPDGTVFATGAASGGGVAHTAVYVVGATPGDPGTFRVGPDFAFGDDADDASAALLPSGHVLIAAPSGRFYEYDGAAMPVVAALSTGTGAGAYFLLPLPNGQVLVTGGVTQLYAGSGNPSPAWEPTVTSAPAVLTRGVTYPISGTQFNGLSQAANVGDELNAATNYPLVRITNTASGHVTYGRTHGHSTMAVATGSAIVSTFFDVSPVTEIGASTLTVVANGIESAAVSVMVN